jgi:hypothetical protein
MASTSSAIDTNISTLPAADQARTDIVTSGTTTTITVTGPALSGLEATTTAEAPNLVLDGSFRDGTFTGGGTFKEFFSVTSDNKVINSRFNLGEDNFKDTLNFGKKASAKKVTVSDFGDNDKLKYKGKTYTADDIVGNRFVGISKNQIKLA